MNQQTVGSLIFLELFCHRDTCLLNKEAVEMYVENYYMFLINDFLHL